MVEDASDLRSILIPLLEGFIVRCAVLKFFFEVEDLHFEADNIVVLISYNFFDSSHIDVRFLGERASLSICKIPGLDLSFHFAIFLFDVPDACLESIIVLFDSIDDAFVVIIFIPDEVLGGHIAMEVDAGLEDVMVGVDFLSQLVFVFDAAVQQPLLCLELLVVLAQQQNWGVIKIFHSEEYYNQDQNIPPTPQRSEIG